MQAKLEFKHLAAEKTAFDAIFQDKEKNHLVKLADFFTIKLRQGQNLFIVFPRVSQTMQFFTDVKKQYPALLEKMSRRGIKLEYIRIDHKCGLSLMGDLFDQKENKNDTCILKLFKELIYEEFAEPIIAAILNDKTKSELIKLADIFTVQLQYDQDLLAVFPHKNNTVAELALISMKHQHPALFEKMRAQGNELATRQHPRKGWGLTLTSKDKAPSIILAQFKKLLNPIPVFVQQNADSQQIEAVPAQSIALSTSYHSSNGWGLTLTSRDKSPILTSSNNHQPTAAAMKTTKNPHGSNNRPLRTSTTSQNGTWFCVLDQKPRRPQCEDLQFITNALTALKDNQSPTVVVHQTAGKKQKRGGLFAAANATPQNNSSNDSLMNWFGANL